MFTITRMNMTFAPQQRARLAAFIAARDNNTVSFLNDAVSFVEVCFNGCAGGRAIASIDHAQKKWTELKMPHLSAAATAENPLETSDKPFFNAPADEPSEQEKKNPDLIRVMYNSEQSDRLIALQARGGMASIGELINLACMLFIWADGEIKNGRTLISINQTKEYVILDVSAVTGKK